MRFLSTLELHPNPKLSASLALAESLRDDAPLPATPTITTGLNDLDRAGAIRGGQPTVIAGPPGVGATSLALSIVLHVLRNYSGPVVYVTDHLSHSEIERRLLAQHARIDLSKLARNELSQEQTQRGQASQEALARSKLLVVDAADGITTSRVAQLADSLAQVDAPPQLLVVDRIDALRDPAGNAGQSTRVVANLLDLIQQHQAASLLVERPAHEHWTAYPHPEHEPPSVGVSQSHRDLARRLQSVLWLHRAELYDRDTPDIGIGDIHILWQRHGPTGYVRAAYLHHLGLWGNLARPAPP